jgi:methylmalonyl-CoA mutase
MQEPTSLFTDFEPASKEKWYLRALREMKGTNFDEQMIWKMTADMKIQPFYTKEDLSQNEHLKNYQHGSDSPNVSNISPRHWVFRQKIDVGNQYRQANKYALNALINGADGIEFHLDSMISFEAIEALLENIHIKHCDISFYTTASPMQLLCAYRCYAREKGLELNEMRGSLGFTYLGVREMGFTEMSQVIILGAEMPNYQVLPVSGVRGLSPSLDVSSMLANFAHYVEKIGEEGITPAILAREIDFRVRMGNDYFVEIAKLRALRMLFSELVKYYGVEDFNPYEMKIHAITTPEISDRTKKDPYWNILVNTNQSMAAIIGGCNTLTILPHTDGLAPENELADRIARNISNILKEETYFDKVSDPAAGSYYIENLTDAIAEKAWEKFRDRYI